jgi:hypothetical protein
MNACIPIAYIVLNIAAISIIYTYYKQMELSDIYYTPEVPTYKAARKKFYPQYNTTNLLKLQQIITAEDATQPLNHTLHARNLYKKIIQAIPQIYATLLKLENCYAKIKRYDDAVAAHNTAMNLNPLQLLRSLALAIIDKKKIKYVSKLKKRSLNKKLIVCIKSFYSHNLKYHNQMRTFSACILLAK